jgi:hypothetical protein
VRSRDEDLLRGAGSAAELTYHRRVRLAFLVTALLSVVACKSPADARAPSANGSPTIIVGTWSGTEGTHFMEETWSPADADGVMHGAFRDLDGTAVEFTETMTLAKTGDEWVLHIHMFEGGPHPGGREHEFEFHALATTGTTIDFRSATKSSVERIVYDVSGDRLTISLYRNGTPEPIALNRAH